jgi:hypothetical protein
MKKLRVEFSKCLLPFTAQSPVVQFPIPKYKDHDIQNYKFACCFSGCKVWSLTLKEEHRLKVSENRVLRKIFGSKRDELTGEWRKVHIEELRDLYSSLTRACCGELVKVLCYKPEGRGFDFIAVFR